MRVGDRVGLKLAGKKFVDQQMLRCCLKAFRRILKSMTQSSSSSSSSFSSSGSLSGLFFLEILEAIVEDALYQFSLSLKVVCQ